MKIPFSPPDITEEEIAEVIDTLKSGWITTGPKTKKFENEISKYCGTNKTVCLNSQTACQEMTLRVLGIGPGDEVIVPAYTYTASCSVIYHVGATPIMIDSQKDYFEMDYDALEKAITPNTKAIIPVDLGGVVCDYDRIYEIVERKKSLFKPNNEIQRAIGRVIISADTAHSFGSKRNGNITGSIADFSSFSFHAVKNLTTAEGGAVTWKDIPGIDNEEIYKKYMLLSLHGQNKDALAKTKLGSWEYDIIEPYYKCNMTDIMASLGLVQLKRYEVLLKRRREIVERYDKAFKKLNVSILKHFGDNHSSCAHLYIVRLNGKDFNYRNDVITKLAELGIASNVHYKPLPMLSAYKQKGFDILNYPNAYDLYQNAITLPLHTNLTDEEIEYLIDSFVRILSEEQV